MSGSASRSTHVAVVGAGAFGGWTALWLLRRGCRVTLLDAWGAGNSRASSGGETRVTRAVYGADRVYVEWVARSLPIWREHEERWGETFLRRTGALWLFSGPDQYARASLPLLAEAGLPASELSPADAARRFPQIDFSGVASVFFEEEAGYLFARRSCQAVARAVAAEGGEVRQLAATPGPIGKGGLERLDLSDGSTLAADAYVFACGPWLGSLFPEVIGERGMRPTRQEVFFFGLPAGDSRYTDEQCPVWFHLGEKSFYGMPGNEHRGFKVADDTRGEPIDPTTADRTPSPEKLAAARGYVAERFPGLAGAPLVESRVCQYENSVDGQLYFDRHPEAANLWILGGGSGHGFKLGPSLGQDAAAAVLGELEPPAMFALGRIARAGEDGWKTQLLGRS